MRPAPLIRAARADASIPLPLSSLIEGEHKRGRRGLIVWISVGLGLASIGVGIWFWARPRPVAMEARFRSQPITHGDVVREVRATGRVEAVSTVSVGAEISGRIATVEVDFNDRVRKGQVLARFDRSSLEAQRSQQAANVAGARSQLVQARYDLDLALRTLGRSEALYARKAQSEQEHDNAVVGARLAAARVHAAEALADAQAALFEVARTNLDHAVIRAPIDGVIITRNVDPGQTVAAMLQTPVLFTVAADLRKMRVLANVDEADIGEVAVGQLATSTVSGYADRVFEGTVTEVRNSPVVVQDVVTYAAVVALANPDLSLRPGMTATVRIRVAEARAVDRLPSAALQFTPPGEQRASTPGAWTLDAGRVRHVPVHTTVSDGEVEAMVSDKLLPVGARVLTELTAAGRKAYGLDRRP